MAQNLAGKPGNLEPDVEEVLLVVGRGSEAEDVQMLVGNPSGTELVALLLHHVEDGLSPCPGAEVGAIRVQRRILILGSNQEDVSTRHVGSMRLGRVLARQGLHHAIAARLLDPIVLLVILVAESIRLGPGGDRLVMPGCLTLSDLCHRGGPGLAYTFVAHGRGPGGRCNRVVRIVAVLARRLPRNCRQACRLRRQVIVPEGTCPDKRHPLAPSCAVRRVSPEPTPSGAWLRGASGDSALQKVALREHSTALSMAEASRRKVGRKNRVTHNTG